MDFNTGEKRRQLLIGSVIVLFMIIALTLRMIPGLFIPSQGFLLSSGADVWYTLRQVEVMAAHFPTYNWFDPMTAYPEGKTIDWGPLYPFLATVLCLVSGASSRAEIVNCAGWISPLMAAILVPVTYKLGRMIWDWKAGLVAAGFVSVLSYVSFFQSAYGWVDHNFAETFFVALFFLSYLIALEYSRRHPADLADLKTFGMPFLLSSLAGILYFLGYITAPTVLIALLVAGIYTFIQSIIDYASGERSEYLLLTNGLIFFCIVILEILFGFPREGLSLTTYSVGHPVVMLGLIAETVVLYCLARLFHKNRLHYYLSLAGIVACGVSLLQFLPTLHTIRDQAVSLVFGSSAYSIAIRETQVWTFSAAYDSFNLALILMAGGIVIIAWHSIKKRESGQIFLLVWFTVILILTLPHQRFQLYLTMPAALAAAICTTEAIRWSWDGVGDRILLKFSMSLIRENATDGNNAAGKKERKTKKAIRESGPVELITVIKGVTLGGIVIIAGLAFFTSAAHDFSYVAGTPENGIQKDWMETLVWMKDFTPPVGIDYFQKYDRQTFVYPNTSYGILAPWEEGHRITFFARRLPITNPFQDNLAGAQGTSAFYLSNNEAEANNILSNLGGRYVTTDLGTATDTFPALIPWMTNSAEVSPYIYWFFINDPKSPSGLTKTHLLGNDYFQTMIVRLQVFDGSMVLPDTAQYTRYIVRSVPDTGDTSGSGGQARVIIGTQIVNVSQDTVMISPEGKVASPGATYADIYSNIPYQPVKKVPALTHYRLVHESPTNISIQLFGSAQDSTLPDIRIVKVFEYVKGAHISGEGIIELPLVTNTGRIFVYRQESSGGEFIVPYATVGGSSEVRATGPYHIAGTPRTIAVTETDIREGRTVK